MCLLLTAAVALIALTTASDPSSKARQLASMGPGDEAKSPPRPSMHRVAAHLDLKSLDMARLDLARLSLKDDGGSPRGSRGAQYSPRGNKRSKSPSSPHSDKNPPKKKKSH
ncbi:hypothetical protein Ae201684P_019335 [Aphanomyces euteiches]|nr:hypothetical protein Ae201684P_019335 [Aphanomyces euteiches]